MLHQSCWLSGFNSDCTRSILSYYSPLVYLILYRFYLPPSFSPSPKTLKGFHQENLVFCFIIWCKEYSLAVNVMAESFSLWAFWFKIYLYLIFMDHGCLFIISVCDFSHFAFFPARNFNVQKSELMIRKVSFIFLFPECGTFWFFVVRMQARTICVMDFEARVETECFLFSGANL